MRLLQRLRHDADLAHDAVLDAAAPLLRRVERPRRALGGHLPVLALEAQHVLRPRALDDAEVLLERLAVRLVDGVVLARRRAVDAVELLRHHVDPAALVAAREAGVRPPAAHVVEHRDVFGDAQRVLRRQHDAELADADALRLHRDVEVEQHGVVREFEPLDVEVVLRERDRVVAERVGRARLLDSSASIVS